MTAPPPTPTAYDRVPRRRPDGRPLAPVAQPRRSCGKDGNPTPRRSPPVLDETEADEVDKGPDQETIGSGEFTWAKARRVVIRTRERHSAIQELASAGMSISAIGRKLSLNRRTVRRFVRATDVEELLANARFRTSLLDEFKPYLHERFNAGCTDRRT